MGVSVAVCRFGEMQEGTLLEVRKKIQMFGENREGNKYRCDG